MGGIGKTTLAKYFIDTYHHEYTNVLWINAANGVEKGFINNELLDSLKLLSQIHNFANQSSKFDKIIASLRSEEPPHSLLIIDNADKKIKSEVLKKIQLKPNWKVIITSRSRVHGFELFPLKPLSENLCIELFFKNYKKETQDANTEKFARLIVKAVYHHTLTIELLAKTTNNNPTINIASLWETMTSKGISEELDVNIEIDFNRIREAKTTISKCLNIAFSISEFNSDKLSKRILGYLSILPPTQIEYKVLKNLFKVSSNDEKKFINSINYLYERGWIELETNGSYTYIYMHPIIQATIRKKIKPLLENFTDLIVELSKNLTFRTYKAQQHNRDIVLYTPFVEAIIAKYENQQDLSIASLSNAYSQLLGTFLGDRENALKYSLKALSIRTEKLREDHEEVIESLNASSTAYRHMNKYAESLDLINQALHILERKPEKSEETYKNIANCYNTQGQLYKSWGKADNALNSFKMALELIENQKLFHPHLEACINDNIGNTYIYYMENKVNDALPYFQHSVSLGEKYNDPQIFIYYNNIAGCYLDLDDYNKAELYIKKVIENYEGMPSKETNGNLAIAYNQYADILHEKYLLSKNENEIEKSIEYRNKGIVIKTKNKNITSLAISLNGMAKTLSEDSQYKNLPNAVEYAESAAMIFKNSIGNQKNLKSTYNVLISIYTKMKNTEKVRETQAEIDKLTD